jgi:spore coat protein CotF
MKYDKEVLIMITNVQLTQKERTLLEDQKSHEEICILKYSNYANLASDQELKNIFNSNKQQEQSHLNSINQLLSGQVPSTNSGSSSSGQQSQSGSQSSSSGSMSSASMGSSSSSSSSNGSQPSDKDLCTDILMTEKYVSSTYNTAIFEFKDPQVRDVLNHIQKEEQKHGEAVFKYMESKGLYSPQ